MPRKKNPENQGLPERWRFTRNAYYYQVPVGQEHAWDNKKTFRLGKTLPEAYKAWAERLEYIGNVRTIGDLLDRYGLEVIPTKALKTQKDNFKQLTVLKNVFGNMPLQTITPQHIYQYIDKRGAPTAARLEKALLSHAYTKAIEWGYVTRHPFRGQIRIKGTPRRTRYVEDWEVKELFSLPRTGFTNIVLAYIPLKILTGLRKKDLLLLKVTALKEDGVHITTSKTQKKIVIEWTDALRKAIDYVIAVRPVDISPYLFCNRRGLPYYDEKKASASGFDSNWQRFMKKVIEETNITEKFTEHDLRAKTGSDSDSDEMARKLLTHGNVTTTRSFYRRRAERVKPLN